MNEIYRVTSQERGFYRIDDGEGEYFAEVSGRLRHEAASRLDYPVVGDLVQADLRDDRAIIERVLLRHSLLVRRMAGGEGEQVIAANLDTLFVCMALNRDFNLRRLERYLAIAWESGAMPVVLLSKTDLCDRVEERIAQVRATAPGVQVLCLGPFAQDAPELLAPWLGEGAGGQPLSHPPAAAPLSGEPSDTNSIGSLEACPGEGDAVGSADMSFPENSGKPQTSAASVYGGRQSSIEPAEATGSGSCPAGTLIYGSKIRVRNRRQPVEVGPARRIRWKTVRARGDAVGSADPQSARNLADSKNSGTPIYGSRIRVENRRQPVEAGTARPAARFAPRWRWGS